MGAQVVHLEKLYRQYRDRVEFAFIYISEARHKMPGYEFLLEEPRSTTESGQARERREKVCRAIDVAQMTVPVYLDGADRTAARAYFAWPARLVVVDTDGRIARDFGSLPFHPWNWGDVSNALQTEIAQQPMPLHEAAE